MSRQRLQATIILFVGLGLTVLAGWVVDEYYQRARTHQIGLQTDNATYAVKVALDRVAIAVQAVRALYASDWVTAEQFERFARTLSASEAIRSLSFYRRVTDADRLTYEQRFDTEPAARLGIWQYDAAGQPVRAAERPLHFVVEAAYLLSGQAPSFGLDVMSVPGRAASLEESIATLSLVASEPIRFIDTGAEGVLLYVPARDQTGNVVGIAAGSISFDELASVARMASGVTDVTIAVGAEPAAAGQSAAGPAAPNGRSFAFGGRTWTVEVAAAPPEEGFARWAMFLILGAGLAATAAVLAWLANRAKTSEVVAARARLRGMLDGLGPLAWLIEADGTIVNANRAAIAAFGRARDSGVGKPFWELPVNSGRQEQAERLRQAVLAAAGGEDIRFDFEVDQDDAHKVFDLWIRPLATIQGEPRHLVASAVDVTDRYEGEETQRLLMRELDHRMKNTLQVIQAIIRRTARAHATVPKFEQSLLGRVNAMARAHDLLAQERWLGADMATVVKQETANFDSGGAIAADGPSLRLNPKAALSIALAMHELGTNASKYGALSAPGGKVAVAWSVVRGGREPCLVIRWVESGGPPVAEPKERGFGSMLIERSFAYELDGEAKLDYRREGVVCTISVPLRTVRPFVAEQEAIAATGVPA